MLTRNNCPFLLVVILLMTIKSERVINPLDKVHVTAKDEYKQIGSKQREEQKVLS